MSVAAAQPPRRTAAGLARDRLLAQALEVSADAIFCQDAAGCLLTWNAAAERTYGFREGEVVGRLAQDVLPALTWQELQECFATALSGERVERFDGRHERKDGSLVPVNVSAAPLRDDDDSVVGAVTTVADIRDRHRMVADLERARVRLERQNTALLRSNRDLEQFAYVASHDLSEPLRVITGYIGRIEHRFSDVLDERGLRYMQHIVEATTRMRSLIDDLLDYSRFLRAPHETSVLDTDAALQRVLKGLDRQLQEAGATVTTHHLPPVCSDTNLVESLLSNLIGNACKFRSPDRLPHIDVHAAEVDGRVTLCVDDNGIGIAPEYRERVFRMFQRLHVREAYPGTGIGLAIAQQIVEGQDGRIWVEDSPLGGTRVCCTLPAGATQEDDSA